MKVIGLCGGSGSGKGAVSALFAEYGIPSIDTDKIYSEITSYRSECMEALISAFGPSVANDDGSLNRVEMRRLVFSSEGSEARRKLLNDITHKFVLAETDRRIDEYRRDGKAAVIADVPLLFESGFDAKCDFIVAVVADKDTRISRIVDRDGITKDQAEKRIMTQIPAEELIKRSDFVIDNNGSVDKLRENVRALFLKLNS
jgi:dephospho-CoA kinase